MRLSIAGLATFVATAHAFRDTSPFLLFSTSPLPSAIQDASNAQIQAASDVLKAANSFLATCPSDIYYIISQPSVRASDFSSQSSFSNLKYTLQQPRVQARISVSQVLGLEGSTARDLAFYIKKQCGDIDLVKLEDRISAGPPGKKFMVLSEFDELPSSKSDRTEGLADNDLLLYDAMRSDLLRDVKYTVIYTTTPAWDIVDETPVYEAAFASPVHTDLRRDIWTRDGSAGSNKTDPRPLFEKYQFFTPGLFMSLFVGLLLLAILSVGLAAVSSLKVSYGAFDKEMGPSANKKQ